MLKIFVWKIEAEESEAAEELQMTFASRFYSTCRLLYGFNE
jgi:hypothetical protein